MYATAQKEQFSLAYVHAVASASGFNLGRFEVDDDSVDVVLKARGLVENVRSPHLELQLKCTQNLAEHDEGWTFPLKRKNYEDLRPTDLHVPKLLVVLRVPSNPSDWITQSTEEMVLRHCAFWRCLYGEPAMPDEKKSITVTVPRKNVFNVAGLKEIIKRIGEGVKAL